MTSNLPFPQHLDSSRISTYRSCPQQFNLNYLRHKQPSEASIHLHAGGCIAKGLEASRNAYHLEQLSPKQSLHKGQIAIMKEWGDRPIGDHPKDLSSLLLALEGYFTHWGWESDHLQPYWPEGKNNGKPAIEFSFALPLDTPHPETGDPILYVGRCDMLAVYQDKVYVVDDKTTGQMGASFFNKWDLRGQLMGYTFAARAHNYPVVGSMIRGICFRKNDIGYAECVQRRPEWQLSRWWRETNLVVERMVNDWRNDSWAYDFADACEAYGGCSYKEVCLSQFPEKVLETNFETIVWNPLQED